MVNHYKWTRLADGQVAESPEPNVDPNDPKILRWDNGLVLYNDFITEDEETAIMDTIVKNDKWTGIGKRITLHYGPHFDYTTFGVSDSDTPSPSYITDLLPRLPIQDHLPDQFTVQYYPPGTGIPPHVDTHSAFREALYSLSLGATVPMAFRRCGTAEAVRMRRPKRSLQGTIEEGKAPQQGQNTLNVTPEVPSGEPWELFLPQRSLLVMTGASRFGYTHKIKGRKFDQRDGMIVERNGRYSITMRSVKRGAEIGCECEFPEMCDARIRKESEAQK